MKIITNISLSLYEAPQFQPSTYWW